jgi:4-amino-4-deoxy-L-arabinose transferase-like glycosyltransferase
VKSLTPTHRLILLVILITAAFLRFYNYSNWSLSNDELSALNRLRYNTFSDVIKEGVMLNDMHPPGVQTFLYALTKCCGNDVAVVRLPFVLMGILSVIAFFKIADKLTSRQGALCATSMFVALIFPVLYSQLARPYSPGLLFSLLAVYFLITTVYDDKNEKNDKIKYLPLIFFIVFGTMCMYIHYFAFLFVGIAGLFAFIIARPKIKIWLTAAGLLMLILFMPAFSIFQYQMGIGGLGGDKGWLGPPENDVFIQLLFYIFNESYFLIINKYQNVNKKYQIFSILLFTVPFLIAFFYSIFKNPIYQHSIMIFSFPYLLLFIFSFTPNFNNKKLIALCLTILFITTLSTVTEKGIYRTQYFGVFKELAENAVKSSDEHGANNITFTTNVIMPFYADYYPQKLNQNLNYQLYSCNTAAGLAKLNEVASSSDKEFLSYSWSNTANPEETEQIITKYFPYKSKVINYFNSGYRLYSKNPTKGFENKYLYKFEYGFEALKFENEAAMLTHDIFHSDSSAILYNPENEFGPAYKISIKEAGLKKGNVIWLQAWINTDNIPSDGNLVLQIDANGKTLNWQGAPIKDYALQAGKWFPVYLAHRVTESLPENAIISAYLWNSGRKKIYTDDLSLYILP